MIKAVCLPGAKSESKKVSVHLNIEKTMSRECSILHTSHLQVRHCLGRPGPASYRSSLL